MDASFRAFASPLHLSQDLIALPFGRRQLMVSVWQVLKAILLENGEEDGSCRVSDRMLGK